MIPYNVTVPNNAMSTTNDFLTLTAAAARSLLITEIDLTGSGATSASNVFNIFGVATVGATPTAITPTPIHPNSPAAAFTAASTWGTAPVVNAVTYKPGGFNAIGGRYYWRFQHLYDIIPISGGNNAAATRSFRSTSGTSTVYGGVKIVEI